MRSENVAVNTVTERKSRWLDPKEEVLNLYKLEAGAFWSS